MSNDPSQPDLAWRGYSGWAMLPSFMACLVATLFLQIGNYLFDEARGVLDKIGSWGVFTLTLAIWIVQIFRWLYRGATYVYRLAPERLFVDRGFLYPPEPAVELSKVWKVTWGADMLSRWFGVGWVRVTQVDGEVVGLPGVVRPAAFAEQIEAAVKKLAEAKTASAPSA